MHSCQSLCKTVLVKGLAVNFTYVQSDLTASKFVSLMKTLQNIRPLTLKRTPLPPKNSNHQTPKHGRSCTENQELLVGRKLKEFCVQINFRIKKPHMALLYYIPCIFGLGRGFLSVVFKMEFRCLCLFIRYTELCGTVEFDSLAPSAWMGLRKPRLAMFVHKHWLLMITCTSEASCKSTFLPFLLEQPCSVLCDCCLHISGSLVHYQ